MDARVEVESLSTVVKNGRARLGKARLPQNQFSGHHLLCSPEEETQIKLSG